MRRALSALLGLGGGGHIGCAGHAHGQGPQNAEGIEAGVVNLRQEYQVDLAVGYRQPVGHSLGHGRIHALPVQPGPACGKLEALLIAQEADTKLLGGQIFRQIGRRILQRRQLVPGIEDVLGGREPEIREDHLIEAQIPQLRGDLATSQFRVPVLAGSSQ